MIKGQNLSFRLGSKYLIKQIDLHISRGKFWALVGPNGAGKSTLFNLLAGDLKPSMGSIRLNGRLIQNYTATELARTRAYLLQQRQVEFPFKVLDIVLLGRSPYLSGSKESIVDRTQAYVALKRLDSEEFSDRIYPTLSGGEASRVDMARIITQDTELLLLDEPSNHLDPRHQIRLLEICQSLTLENRTIMAAMHDLNLASLFADQIVMLNHGQIVAVGSPNQVFTKNKLEEAYQLKFEIIKHSSGRPLIIPKMSAQPGIKPA